MTIYIVAYLIILFLVLTREKYKTKQKHTLLIFWSIFIALICGLRDMLGGYDSYIYAEVFDSTSNQLDAGIPFYRTSAIELNPTELGYAYYNVILAYITANRYIFFLITALLFFSSIYYHIVKFSKYPILAFFILWGMWYFFSFTYIRQILAASICWFAIPFAIKRKPWKFFAIVTLAATFHNSAGLFYLLYFIANKQFTKTQIILFTSLSLLLGLTPIGNLIFYNIGGAINEEKTAGALAHTNSGRIDYLIEAFFFLSLILYKFKDIPKDQKSTCMLNISLLFIFILTFFVRFPDGGRMSWYFLIGIASTTAQLSMKGFNKSTVKAFILFTVSLLFFRILFGWGTLLSPYKSFLTNGYRENDVIYQNYEYDTYYSDNKLYRTPFKFFK